MIFHTLAQWFLPAGPKDYALLFCCLISAWALGDAIRIFPLALDEFRELNAQRRHRQLLAKLKGK